MGRREENKERTRQQLIDVGMELFRSRGFDDTRVQDIVERVGVSPATFFNYFPTKDAILEAQADATADLYAALLRHELDRNASPVSERLEQITRVLAEFLQADIPIAQLMVTRTPLFFGASGAKADKDRDAQQLLADLFKQGQATGEIRPDADPLQLSELYTGIVTITAANWLTEWWGPNPQPLPERLVAAAATLLLGARAQPSPRRPRR